MSDGTARPRPPRQSSRAGAGSSRQRESSYGTRIPSGPVGLHVSPRLRGQTPVRTSRLMVVSSDRSIGSGFTRCRVATSWSTFIESTLARSISAFITVGFPRTARSQRATVPRQRWTDDQRLAQRSSDGASSSSSESSDRLREIDERERTAESITTTTYPS